jgi:hypothetical protein
LTALGARLRLLSRQKQEKVAKEAKRETKKDKKVQ